jgi:hypothetical protein
MPLDLTPLYVALVAVGVLIVGALGKFAVAWLESRTRRFERDVDDACDHEESTGAPSHIKHARARAAVKKTWPMARVAKIDAKVAGSGLAAGDRAKER